MISTFSNFDNLGLRRHYGFKGFPGPDFMTIFFGDSIHTKEHQCQISAYYFFPGLSGFFIQCPDYL